MVANEVTLERDGHQCGATADLGDLGGGHLIGRANLGV
jgi:hypothetical protein